MSQYAPEEISRNVSDEIQFDKTTEATLYDGSSHTFSQFNHVLNDFSSRHNISDAARRELEALFAMYLPQPNEVLHKRMKPFLPATISFNRANSQFFCLDAYQQLNDVVKRNWSFFLDSWLKPQLFETPKYPFRDHEIQLILNLDGVSLFKSRKFCIWPFWLQCVKLPPKIRSKFDNNILLCVWYGLSKPDWSFVLPKVAFELEKLSESHNDEKIGTFRCKITFLVCDMPAKAPALNMNQFNGYNGCTHCLLIGCRLGSRLIYPCDQAFIMRDQLSFHRHAIKAEKRQKAVAGIKGISSLSSFFSFPADALIDPMHQVFLGTGKVLCKLFINSLKSKELDIFDKLLNQYQIPVDFLRRPKNVVEMQHWKASDFKILFLHLIPLSMDLFESVAQCQKLSFSKLSTAIRLLSLRHISSEELDSASRLIAAFFTDFKELYGEAMQTYNFHSMRHMCDQVRLSGPLWNCSAFGFESANHFLIKSLSGTIKHPEKIIETFLWKKQIAILRNQSNLISEPGVKQFSNLTCASDECVRFAESSGLPRSLMGRYKNQLGTIFWSDAYSRKKENLSNSIVWSGDIRFHQIAAFAETPSGIVAFARKFGLVETITKLGELKVKKNCQIFKLANLENLSLLDVSCIEGKCVILPIEDFLLASPVSEGFEHN